MTEEEKKAADKKVGTGADLRKEWASLDKEAQQSFEYAALKDQERFNRETDKFEKTGIFID